MKKSRVVMLVAVLMAVSGVIILGFSADQESDGIIPFTSQYAKLEQYKGELEKINKSNQEMLADLQDQIKNSDDVNLEQIKQEIKVIRQVISENKAELEDVIRRLTEIKSEK